MPSLATLLIYLMAGTALGLLTLRTGIPAAPLAGALLGAGLVSMSGRLDVAEWPSGTPVSYTHLTLPTICSV